MNQTILIAILSPILITSGGLVSWLIKSKKEEILNIEAKSREFKIETYKKLLEPFIATFTTTIPEKKRNLEVKKILSLEYKKTILAPCHESNEIFIKLDKVLMVNSLYFNLFYNILYQD